MLKHYLLHKCGYVQQSIYYVNNPYAKVSSFAAHDGHQAAEDQEPQPSHQEQPRLKEQSRNPTRNKCRPWCGTGHHYGD